MHPKIEAWARKRLEDKRGGPVGPVKVWFDFSDDYIDDGAWNDGGGATELRLVGGTYPDPVMIDIELKNKHDQYYEDLMTVIGQIIDTPVGGTP